MIVSVDRLTISIKLVQIIFTLNIPASGLFKPKSANYSVIISEISPVFSRQIVTNLYKNKANLQGGEIHTFQCNNIYIYIY
jgi:hypothetical protein